GAVGGLPDPPRGGPRRHGRGLRGRAGVAGPPRRPEGPGAAGPAPSQATAPVPSRGAGGGAAASHQHRAGLRRGRVRGTALLRRLLGDHHRGASQEAVTTFVTWFGRGAGPPTSGSARSASPQIARTCEAGGPPSEPRSDDHGHPVVFAEKSPEK